MALNFDKMSTEQVERLFEQYNEFPAVAKEDMIKISEFNWEKVTGMVYLTCVNHPYSRYLTKDPYSRSIHYLQGPRGLFASLENECACSAFYLRVVKEHNTSQKEESPMISLFDEPND